MFFKMILYDKRDKYSHMKSFTGAINFPDLY